MTMIRSRIALLTLAVLGGACSTDRGNGNQRAVKLFDDAAVELYRMEGKLRIGIVNRSKEPRLVDRYYWSYKLDAMSSDGSVIATSDDEDKVPVPGPNDVVLLRQGDEIVWELDGIDGAAFQSASSFELSIKSRALPGKKENALTLLDRIRFNPDDFR